MAQGVDFLLIFVALLGLAALGSSRRSTRTQVVSLQGITLGILLLLVHSDEITLHLIALATFIMLVKGMAIPWLLLRASRSVRVDRDIQPYIGPTMSMILGAAALGVGFGLASRLPLPQAADSRLVVPVSLATLFMGMLLLISRRTAISQVLGYIVMENGIFTFSLVVAAAVPTLVEMAILLDLFVAVFVMGITIYEISREFDHIDATRLRELQDMRNSERRRPLPDRDYHNSVGRRADRR